ncbi:hypothetical protein IWQ57_002488, partial [Coemansia nantahalensis]
MDPRGEQRREFLYANLKKQLDQLSQNFDALNRNMDKLREQTEQSQRLAVLHASLFMGAKT